jgi:hypothetical protein
MKQVSTWRKKNPVIILPWTLFITIVTLSQCECMSCDSTEYPYVSISIELQHMSRADELNRMPASDITSPGFINLTG